MDDDDDGIHDDAMAILPPSSRTDLKRWNGCDIVRKGGRKTRYVFLFPASFNLSAGGGKIGNMAKMDTETPVLYIDFPEVRKHL